jgi:D-hexose-6-phosphate mutarotase
MEPDGWRTMLCVETANVGDSSITLATGESHTMRAVISVEAIG